jgi:hypothetical protein
VWDYVLVAVAASLPFAGFLASNSSESFGVGHVLAVAVATVALVLAAYVGTVKVMRGSDPSALAVAWTGLLLAALQVPVLLAPLGVQFTSAGSPWGQLATWLLIAVILGRLGYLLGASRLFRQWLTATLVIICCANLIGFALSGTPQSGDVERLAAFGPPVGPDDAVRQPDVYLLFFDAYARNDVLSELTGADNAPYVRALEERGFDVAERSLASYPSTITSSMALFEGSTPVKDAADAAVGRSSVNAFVRGDNATVNRFRELGYRYHFYDSSGVYSFLSCDPAAVDVCVEPDAPRWAPEEIDRALLGLTPLAVVDAFEPPFVPPDAVFDTVAAGLTEGPDFVFQHVLAPHVPYVYDEKCGVRDPPLSWQGLGPAEELAAYANDVRCLNEATLDIVDRMQATDPEAIIILMSDHGPEVTTPFGEPLSEWTDAELRDRFGVQLAMRLPEECSARPDDETPLIHVFHLVFACIQGTSPELPAYEGYLWEHPRNATPERIPDDRVAAMRQGA